MEENRLTEEEAEGITGGGKAVDYIAEQGKKVVEVLSDVIEDLTKTAKKPVIRPDAGYGAEKSKIRVFRDYSRKIRM